MHTHAEHDTFYTYVETPVGTLMLVGCEDHGLRYISFQCGKGARGPEPVLFALVFVRLHGSPVGYRSAR
jgi:hypothetical protein